MDNRIRYVYKIIREDKLYIGSTFDTERRWKEHSKDSNSKKMKKDIDKYGWDSFTKEIIFSGTEDEVYEEEMRLITKLKPYYNHKNDKGGKWGKDIKGENHPLAKLKDQDIKDICQRVVMNGEKVSDVVKDYRFIHISILYSIVNGKSWEHVDAPRKVASVVGENNENAKLKEQDIIDICQRVVVNKEHVSDVVKDYPYIGISILYGIVNGESWKHVNAPRKHAIVDTEGEKHPMSKLKELDIIDICTRVVINKEPVLEVAKDYNFVEINMIYRIVNGESWTHVNVQRKKRRQTQKRLTKEEVLDIRELASEGFSAEDIQKYIYTNIKVLNIKNVINRKTFKNI